MGDTLNEMAQNRGSAPEICVPMPASMAVQMAKFKLPRKSTMAQKAVNG